MHAFLNFIEWHPSPFAACKRARLTARLYWRLSALALLATLLVGMGLWFFLICEVHSFRTLTLLVFISEYLLCAAYGYWINPAICRYVANRYPLTFGVSK